MANVLFLNVGDMVYLKLDGTIYQGRVSKMVTYEKLTNYCTLSLDYELKELEIELANGKVITLEDTNVNAMNTNNGITLYPSVDELRKGWRGNRYYANSTIHSYNGGQSLNHINRLIGLLRNLGFEINSNNIMPKIYKNNGISVVEKSFKYIVNYHDEMLDEWELEFLTYADDAVPHALEEWLETGKWFATYKEAYDAITPEVVMFEEPKPKRKFNKNFAIMDVVYSLNGQKITESLWAETDQFHDAVAMASLGMYNEINDLFDYDNYNGDEEVFYHQYVIYEVENDELKFEKTPLYKTECYVIN